MGGKKGRVLLAFSIDGEPICGPVKQLAGLYVGVAFHSGGFAYNPAVGEVLAAFVADGRPQIEVGAFAVDRFAAGDVVQYLELNLRQKDVAKKRH